MRTPEEWWGSLKMRGTTLMGRPLNRSWGTPPRHGKGQFVRVFYIDTADFETLTDVIDYIEMVLTLDLPMDARIDAVHELIHATKLLHRAKSV